MDDGEGAGAVPLTHLLTKERICSQYAFEKVQASVAHGEWE